MKLIVFMLSLGGRTSHATKLTSATGLLAAAALLGGVGLAAPAAAQVSVQPDAVSVYAMTPGRLGASVAALVGLIGMVIGGR